MEQGLCGQTFVEQGHCEFSFVQQGICELPLVEQGLCELRCVEHGFCGLIFVDHGFCGPTFTNFVDFADSSLWNRVFVDSPLRREILGTHLCGVRFWELTFVGQGLCRLTFVE